MKARHIETAVTYNVLFVHFNHFVPTFDSTTFISWSLSDDSRVTNCSPVIDSFNIH